jgi:phosphate transport system permease protein
MSGKIKEKIAFTLLSICGLIVVVPIFAILLLLLIKGLPAFSTGFLFGMNGTTKGVESIFPAIIGTIYLVLVAIVVAVPLGISSAIYLNEFASNSAATRIIRLSIVNLAGVPSVVYGLFGVGLFVVFLHFGTSILSGGLTLAFLILPVVITASEEALRTLPNSFREAALALGATKIQTIQRIIVPNALPGMLTGSILGVSRAAGETAPILFTVAAFFLPRLPRSIFDQAMALPYHLYIITTQVPNVAEKYKYGTALTLVLLVFSLNITAMVVRNKFRANKKW